MSEETRPAEEAQTFWGHLAELRRRLLVCAVSLLVGFFVAWGFKEELFALVSAPVREGLAAHGIYRLTAIETVEAIMVYLKLALAGAVVLAMPVALQQLWAFVKPGLTPAEQRPARRVAVLALFMFVLGLLFCYRLVLPLVIDFLTGFTLAAGEVDFQVTMKSAYSTTILFLVGFGLIFELPLAMVLLAATSLVDSARYFRWTRYAIVLAFVVGAVLTPPDVLSQVLMAVPISLLYAVGALLTRLMERRRALNLPVRAGFDWQLLGLVLGASGLIGLLLLPRFVPTSAFLPAGARAVVAGVGEELGRRGCGRIAGRPEMGSSVLVCALYAEGELLLGQSPGEEGAGGCPGLPPGLTCRELGDLWVAGEPLLVARFSENQAGGRQDSGFLGGVEESSWSLFVSLEATEREQRSYLRATVPAEGEPSLRVELGFPDPGQATRLARALVDGSPADWGQPAAAASPERAALELLAAAVAELAAHPGWPPGPAEKVARARALLAVAGGQYAFGQCRSAPCALALLAPYLPPLAGSEAQGRRLMLSYELAGGDEGAAALKSRLMELAGLGRGEGR